MKRKFLSKSKLIFVQAAAKVPRRRTAIIGKVAISSYTLSNKDASGDVGTLQNMTFVAECDEYIRIFVYSNIFDPNIYSSICSYHFPDTNIFVNFLDTNIFGYSFVARF